MIRRFLLGVVEIPILVVLVTGALLVIGLGSDWFINLGVSAFIGAFGMALGIRHGRYQVFRALEIERWKADTVYIPDMLVQMEEHDAPPEVREAMQARLREAKEGLARGS